jgi:hypothetical protein
MQFENLCILNLHHIIFESCLNKENEVKQLERIECVFFCEN